MTYWNTDSEKSGKIKGRSRGDYMDKPKIRIESDGNIVKLWVNGEEVHDVTELSFFAAVNNPENLIRCHYWKNRRTGDGKFLILNNEIITEKVIVGE